jgi:hypothetical protein
MPSPTVVHRTATAVTPANRRGRGAGDEAWSFESRGSMSDHYPYIGEVTDESRIYAAEMVQVEDGIFQRMEGQNGACRFVLRGSSDPEVARAAMSRGAQAVFDVPHPEEPDDPLPNFASSVTQTPDGPSFWIDCKDELDDPDVAADVVAAIVHALDKAGADGVLAVVGHDEA